MASDFASLIPMMECDVAVCSCPDLASHPSYVDGDDFTQAFGFTGDCEESTNNGSSNMRRFRSGGILELKFS